jgi:hypothetical protein
LYVVLSYVLLIILLLLPFNLKNDISTILPWHASIIYISCTLLFVLSVSGRPVSSMKPKGRTQAPTFISLSIIPIVSNSLLHFYGTVRPGHAGVCRSWAVEFRFGLLLMSREFITAKFRFKRMHSTTTTRRLFDKKLRKSQLTITVADCLWFMKMKRSARYQDIGY